jgi:hypothetical protein
MVTHAETGLEAMIAPSLLPPPIHKQSCTAITRAWLHAVLRKRQGTLNRASVYSDSTDESVLTFEMPPGSSTAATAAAAAANYTQQHRQYSNSTVDSDGSSRERSMAFYIAPGEADDDQFAEHSLEKALVVCEKMGLKGFMGPCAVWLRWTQRRLLLNDDAAVHNSSTSASNSNTATPTSYSSRLHSAAFGGRVAVTLQTAPAGSANGRSGGGSPIKRRLSVGLSFTSLEQHNSSSGGGGTGHMSRADAQRRAATAIKAGRELAAAMKQAFALGLVEDLEALANESEAWQGLVPPAPQPSSATTYTTEVETPPSPVAAAFSSALSSTLPLFKRLNSSSEVLVEGSSVQERSASSSSFFAQAAQKAQARVGRLRAGSLLARMHLSRGLASKLKGISSSSSSRRRRHSIADTEPVYGNDEEPVSTSGSLTGSRPFGDHTSARSSLLSAHSSSRAALLQRDASSGNTNGGSGSSDAELLAAAAAARERRLHTTAGYELTGLATQPAVAAARVAVAPLDAAYFADRSTAAQHLRGASLQDTAPNTAATADSASSKEQQAAAAAAVAVARLSNTSAGSAGTATSAAAVVARRAPFVREPAGSSTWVVKEDSGLPYENCNEEAPRLNSIDNDTIDGTDDQLDADTRVSVQKSAMIDDSYSAGVQHTEDCNDVAATLLQQQQHQSEVDGVDDAAYATMHRMPRHGKLRPLQYTPQQW